MMQEEIISVLIVDDDPWMRDLTRLMAESLGYKVIGEGKDGLEAIQLSEILEPDVILMDINMPRLNGLAATRRCCGKVIIITAEDSGIEEKAQMAGAVTCLHKPITRDDLRQALALAIP